MHFLQIDQTDVTHILHECEVYNYYFINTLVVGEHENLDQILKNKFML